MYFLSNLYLYSTGENSYKGTTAVRSPYSLVTVVNKWQCGSWQTSVVSSNNALNMSIY
ncbi:hypothetical protein F7734_21860 [Scytonema sp. UIC 10036]|uniref:hypothetical protein n=1 Tax=Scytonema sp. UIC 10036 TaxID=2304196 RepID=UPI0012DA5FCA|nr:hypothetical protein [Scytonema sp. UIC 10036]MUG94864.1 hypothetical protein [Scytonema sp. UIC 10036]